MQPSGDMVPEEEEQPYKEFVTFLRQSVRASAPVTSSDQSQILARVQERLPKTASVAAGEEEASAQQDAHSDFPQEPRSLAALPRHDHRMSHFARTIAAVLIVGAIITASLLLFTHHSQIPTGSPVGPVGTPVTIQTQTGNIVASMQITSGPYFLSELLAVDISLTNHTQSSVLQLEGALEGFCGTALDVAMSGGNAPDYVVPVHIGSISCPAPLPTALHPGKTITVRRYVPLTKSGQVTLTAEARFYTMKTDSGGIKMITQGPDPLAGRWPSIRMPVVPLIPSDRTLSLQRLGSQVTVNAPPDAQSHLVYLYDVTCQNMETTDVIWSPLTAKTFSQPQCSGVNPNWTYAVGAPGYAIVS